MTLSDGPETPIQWKSESVTDLPTRLGSRDAYASEKFKHINLKICIKGLGKQGRRQILVVSGPSGAQL